MSYFLVANTHGKLSVHSCETADFAAAFLLQEYCAVRFRRGEYGGGYQNHWHGDEQGFAFTEILANEPMFRISHPQTVFYHDCSWRIIPVHKNGIIYSEGTMPELQTSLLMAVRIRNDLTDAVYAFWGEEEKPYMTIQEVGSAKFSEFHVTAVSWSGMQLDTSDAFEQTLRDLSLNATDVELITCSKSVMERIHKYDRKQKHSAGVIGLPCSEEMQANPLMIRTVPDTCVYYGNEYELILAYKNELYYSSGDELLMISRDTGKVISDNFFAEVGFTDAVNECAGAKPGEMFNDWNLIGMYYPENVTDVPYEPDECPITQILITYTPAIGERYFNGNLHMSAYADTPEHGTQCIAGASFRVVSEEQKAEAVDQFKKCCGRYLTENTIIVRRTK